MGLHLQAMAPGQSNAMPLIESLYEEFDAQGVVGPDGHLEAKPWGSRDFGLYDPNGAALVFYEDM